MPLRNVIQLFLSAARSEVFGLNADCSFWTSVRKEEIAVHTPAAYAVAGMVFADTEADAEGLGAEVLLGVEVVVEFELQAAARNATETRATRRGFGIRGAYPPYAYLPPPPEGEPVACAGTPFPRSKLRGADRSKGST
jgi:hypothetical protein